MQCISLDWDEIQHTQFTWPAKTIQKKYLLFTNVGGGGKGRGGLSFNKRALTLNIPSLKQVLLIDFEPWLVFEIELMENPINSSPFAVLYPYLRAGRWWDMLYSNTKIQLFRHHCPHNHHQPNQYIHWLCSKIFLFRQLNCLQLYCSKFHSGAIELLAFYGLSSSQASTYVYNVYNVELLAFEGF